MIKSALLLLRKAIGARCVRLKERIRNSSFLTECLDICRRRQVDEALRESEEKYRVLLSESSDPFFSFTPEGQYKFVNRAFAKGLNLTPEDIIGKKIWDVFSQDEAEKRFKPLSEVFRTGIEKVIEVRVPRPDGDQYYVTTITPIKDAVGNVVNVICSSKNITERKWAEQAMEQAAQRDRHIADVLQQTVMPPQTPMEVPGYEMTSRYQPAMQEADVCGDFCDMFDLGDGRIGMAIGDVAGKGLAAAMRVFTARNAIRCYAFLDDQPSTVMELVNDAICRDIMKDTDMLTAFYAVLDTNTGVLTYSNAGHEPPIFMRSDGEVDYLTVGGLAFIGIDKQTYPADSITMEVGSVLVMFTDGITESRNVGHTEQFGTEGVTRCMADGTNSTAEQIATRILEGAADFANGVFRDDAAIVVIKRTAQNESDRRPTKLL